jgi:eukaryotic translation initiation factor 2C
MHRDKKNLNNETEISVYDYFVKTYDIHLDRWYLPLVETTKDGLFPMELCMVAPNQRYMYKLSSDQTAKMIKFAVTRPKERLGAIKHGVGMLKWNEDPWMKHYGLVIDPNLTLVSSVVIRIDQY